MLARLSPSTCLIALAVAVLVGVAIVWAIGSTLIAAAARPKELWVVEGAAHVDLHAYASADYESRIGGFLARHLASMPVVDER